MISRREVCAALLSTASFRKGPILHPVEFRVIDEVAPRGGTVQFKAEITEAKPITTGSTFLEFNIGFVDEIWGIALLSPGGEAYGVAVVDGTRIALRVVSPTGALGTVPYYYPLLTVVAHVRADAPAWATTLVSLDSQRSEFMGLDGARYALDLKPGTFTVGGSLSIGSVVPGSARLPIGATVSIFGTGFQEGAKVRFGTAALASVEVVNSNRIDVVLGQSALMHGQRIRVTNPDGFAATYYSYQRMAAQGKSARPLFAATAPVFAQVFVTEAEIPSPAGGLFGLALQNAGSEPVDVQIELRGPMGRIGNTAVSIGPNTRWVRAGSELVDGVAGFGTRWRVSASAPIQVLGLIADESAGVVAPLSFTDAPGSAATRPSTNPAVLTPPSLGSEPGR